MNTLNQLQIVILSGDKQDVEAYLGDVSTDQFINDMKAFTTSKLELASLMIAQGLIARRTFSLFLVKEKAIFIAKDILEEANK